MNRPHCPYCESIIYKKYNCQCFPDHIVCQQCSEIECHKCHGSLKPSKKKLCQVCQKYSLQHQVMMVEADCFYCLDCCFEAYKQALKTNNCKMMKLGKQTKCAVAPILQFIQKFCVKCHCLLTRQSREATQKEEKEEPNNQYLCKGCIEEEQNAKKQTIYLPKKDTHKIQEWKLSGWGDANEQATSKWTTQTQQTLFRLPAQQVEQVNQKKQKKYGKSYWDRTNKKQKQEPMPAIAIEQPKQAKKCVACDRLLVRWDLDQINDDLPICSLCFRLSNISEDILERSKLYNLNYSKQIKQHNHEKLIIRKSDQEEHRYRERENQASMERVWEREIQNERKRQKQIQQRKRQIQSEREEEGKEENGREKGREKQREKEVSLENVTTILNEHPIQNQRNENINIQGEEVQLQKTVTINYHHAPSPLKLQYVGQPMRMHMPEQQQQEWEDPKDDDKFIKIVESRIHCEQKAIQEIPEKVVILDNRIQLKVQWANDDLFVQCSICNIEVKGTSVVESEGKQPVCYFCYRLNGAVKKGCPEQLTRSTRIDNELDPENFVKLSPYSQVQISRKEPSIPKLNTKIETFNSPISQKQKYSPFESPNNPSQYDRYMQSKLKQCWRCGDPNISGKYRTEQGDPCCLKCREEETRHRMARDMIKNIRL